MTRKIYNIFIILLITSLASWVSARPPSIKVIYPKLNGNIGAVDSTFIFGSVSKGSRLLINDNQVSVHKDGGFIAFLPLEPGKFEFRLTAINKNDTTRAIRPVSVPKPGQSLSYDSLQIIDRLITYGNLVLTEGDRLVAEFQGTPNCEAYFKIPGFTDSLPMVEIEPKIQPYWGEAVFGTGAVPESLKIKGYYRGFVDIDNWKIPDSTRIYFYLNKPRMSKIIGHIFDTPPAMVDYNFLHLLKLEDSALVDSSKIFIKINPDSFPRMIQFTDSVQIMRVGPRKGYFSIFQPEGVKALAVGAEGEWLKVELSGNQYGWVNQESVEFLDYGLPPPISYIRAVRMFASDDNLVIEFPLTDRHPYRIEEEDSKTISISIFGVNSDTDWIRYDTDDENLELATWSQIEPNVYQLKLQFKRPLWGYDSYYQGNVLKLQINNPPQRVDRLKDKVIVIDPGHSPDVGAVGPTGFTEKEANLGIALALKKELEKRGAEVVMTREDMSPLSLYDRPMIAKAVEADLFVSIHNNALPDGVNPLENNGTSAYYYHPHSIDLASAIHDEIIDAIDINSHGIYYGNLAVNRPTQYPAVLIECAFMIIPEQEAMLKSKTHQKKFAKAIRKGIQKFLEEYNSD